METYRQLVERIAHLSLLSIEDIERRVEAKRAKLSGLVSKEGAAQIVAAELGISLEKERMNIGELMQGMKRANVIGKVVQVFEPRSFQKQGREGRVASFVVADESAAIRAVLWDVNHIKLIEEGSLKVGDVVAISNASMRNGELHLSAFSDVKQSAEKIEQVAAEPAVQAHQLKDAQAGQRMRARAFIVQAYEPRYFEVCPECGKKVMEKQCAIHGTVEPQKRAVLSLVLDDGTETIRGSLFGEQILQLGLSEEEIFSLEKFAEKRADLLGEEFMFTGIVKNNTLYNTTDFTVQNVQKVEHEQLLKELEAKQ